MALSHSLYDRLLFLFENTLPNGAATIAAYQVISELVVAYFVRSEVQEHKNIMQTASL